MNWDTGRRCDFDPREKRCLNCRLSMADVERWPALVSHSCGDERLPFLLEIYKDPHNPRLRLVYADFLDEHGHDFNASMERSVALYGGLANSRIEFTITGHQAAALAEYDRTA